MKQAETKEPTMQQWKYCAIQMSEGELSFFEIKPDQLIQFEPLPEDTAAHIDKDKPSHTIRRWVAALGLRGWELVSVITIEKTYQEWIFKKPIEEDTLSSLWKDQTP
jgi:hypothetical protein